jgi:hypothetical protein
VRSVTPRQYLAEMNGVCQLSVCFGVIEPVKNGYYVGKTARLGRDSKVVLLVGHWGARDPPPPISAFRF